MKLKYILDEYGNFAIFSDANTHFDIAKGFYKKPISAGFCDVITDGEFVDVKCYGESISLGLKSRPQDSDIITKKLNNE